ncbi:MAG TPA: metallophosphoesterase family protein [Gaiellales bacterium]|nr:metallophosphoesterase family protein [Gaiellales bacterium]
MTHLRIVVTGDTHLGPRRRGPLPAALLAACAGADHILHTGDVIDAVLLDELAALAPLDGVAGNCDGWDVAARLPAEQVVQLGGVGVGLVHDPGSERGRRERLRARFPGARAVCFGHTHLPLCDDRDGLLLLNPGSPSERRRAPWHSYAELTIGPEAVLEAHIVRL